MAAAPDMGGAKLAIKSLMLSDDFAETIVTVADQYPDDVPPMDRPAVVYTSEKQVLGSYPAVEILGMVTELVAQNETVSRYLHRLLLVLHLLGDDEETVTAQAERGIVAIRRTLRPPDAGGGVVLTDVLNSGPVLVGREDFEPIAREKPDGSSPFLKVATIEVTVPTWQ